MEEGTLLVAEEESIDYDGLFSLDLSFNGFDGCLVDINPPEEPPNALSCENGPVPMTTAAMQQPTKLAVNKKGKKRGSYNCGKCGLPKKGHVCSDTTPPYTPLKSDIIIPQSQSDSADTETASGHIQSLVNPLYNNKNSNNGSAVVVNIPHGSPAVYRGLTLARQTSSVCGAKRSLSMAEEDEEEKERIRSSHLNANANFCKRRHCSSSSTTSYSSNQRHSHGRCLHYEANIDMDVEMDSVDSMHLPDQSGSGLLSATCLVEVLKRLPPSSLLAASMVCRQWHQYAFHVWSAITETQLLVTHDQKRYIPIMLQRCPNLVHLTLDVRSEIDDYLVKSIACSMHCLASLEIQVSHGGINMVTGDGLNQLVAECKRLCSLKLESCRAIRTLHICSTNLTTLWMADCYSLKAMVINCPSLTELALDFAPEDDGSTDLCNAIENLSQSCPRLSKLHVASVSLNNNVVLALASANFRFLCMLSLTFGSQITDASMAALASSLGNLQLLDLSGSSITDRGLHILCNAFSGTLSKLLIAVCRQISTAGLQMAATLLPFLELLDCGMTIDYKRHTYGNRAINSLDLQWEECEAQQSIHNHIFLFKENKLSNRLVIKHSQLKKLSLWGCSGIHGLYLDCPMLVELNLNSCSSLSPEKMLLQCPALQAVYAGYCKDVVTRAIQNKVVSSFQDETLHFSTKRMADGSKRVQAPQFDIIQPYANGEIK